MEVRVYFEDEEAAIIRKLAAKDRRSVTKYIEWVVIQKIQSEQSSAKHPQINTNCAQINHGTPPPPPPKGRIRRGDGPPTIEQWLRQHPEKNPYSAEADQIRDARRNWEAER